MDKTMKALQNLRAEELRFYCKKNKLPVSGNKVHVIVKPKNLRTLVKKCIQKDSITPVYL